MTQREQQILGLLEENPMISQQELAEKLGITRSSVAVHISNLQKKGHIAGKGYVLRKKAYAVVVGGVNVDIGGCSFGKLVEADSNPGSVQVSLGGVGRNIAHNMSLMGLDVRMLTAIGEDLHGQEVAASCASLGIDINHALRLSDAPTSTYLYIADPQGEMALAVSDMRICERITPAYLHSKLSLLENARVVVADANIPAESLAFLAENCTVPIFCDPVSTTKAERLLPVLDKIHTLKPNRMEAALLAGVPVETKAQVEQAAEVLLQRGVKQVFISCGGDGIYAASKEERLWQPILPGQAVNTTGCGDSAMAAIVWSFLEDANLKDTALAAVAAGAITMESAQTINPGMCAKALKTRMK